MAATLTPRRDRADGGQAPPPPPLVHLIDPEAPEYTLCQTKVRKRVQADAECVVCVSEAKRRGYR